MTAKITQIKAVKEQLAELCQSTGITLFEHVRLNCAYNKVYEIELKLENDNAKASKFIKHMG